MRLLLFSDVHTDLGAAARLVDRVKSDAVDVVLAAGDFANQHRGLETTIEALSAIDQPTVVVPGNNETLDALRSACAGWSTSFVCHGDGVTIDGVEFFGLGGGIPTTPWDWSFDLSDHKATTMLADAPPGCILVLHSPPHGTVDGDAGGRHLGSIALRDEIVRIEPRLVACGHIHAAWEQEGSIGTSRVVNAGPRGVVVDLD